MDLSEDDVDDFFSRVQMPEFGRATQNGVICLFFGFQWYEIVRF